MHMLKDARMEKELLKPFEFTGFQDFCEENGPEQVDNFVSMFRLVLMSNLMIFNFFFARFCCLFALLFNVYAFLE